MGINSIESNATVSVVGVCGINGNLIARILSEHGFNVQANDLLTKDECKYADALKDYPDIKVFHGTPPDEFFTNADYMVLPTAIIKSKNALYRKVKELGIPIIGVDDIYHLFSPTHPCICITGTNGKTTTTALLKHILYSVGMNLSEHNLKGMQGNAADIPALQSRLKADACVLETGTFGVKGSLTKLATPCEPDAGLITNITPDHLSDNSNFLDYAHVKGELIKLLENKTLIVNNDDPTIKALVDELDYAGNLITFGLDTISTRTSKKECLCGSQVKINEFIAGVGIYSCDCGLTYSKPDYLAYNINDSHDEFTLKTSSGEEYDFKLGITGLHNIYNATGSIIMAHEVVGISYDKIRDAVLSFNGVNGRMEKIGTLNGKEIMVDYAHNPAGITTVLKELKNSYDVIVNVLTTSSESGLDGDYEILKCATEYSDYVVPASKNAYDCAKNSSNDKIILPDSMPNDKKQGTLGATKEQVLIGFKRALEIDADLIVCTGEAAFKFKDFLIEKNN